MIKKTMSSWKPYSSGTYSFMLIYMLNYFKDYKTYTYNSCDIFDFVQQKKTRFTMDHPYMLPTLCY